MSKTWDPTDRKYEWSIEKELKEMINCGRFRTYDCLFEGCVETVNLRSDGSANVDVYGKDDKDRTGHWHFNIEYDRYGHITNIKNCHRS